MGQILCFVQWDGAHRKEPYLREDLEFATTPSRTAAMTPITRGLSSLKSLRDPLKSQAGGMSKRMPSESESESDSKQSPIKTLPPPPLTFGAVRIPPVSIPRHLTHDATGCELPSPHLDETTPRVVCPPSPYRRV